MQFRILGPVEVQVDEGWSSIGASKWRTVLAVLLLRAGEVVLTDQLISEVWPEDAPATAVNLISVYVLRLRRLIGDSDGRVLVTRPRGYQLLAGPDGIDAQRFTRLAAEGRAALSAGDGQRAAALLSEALGLWQGNRALTDVPDSELVSAAASGLEEARLAALELRINADLGCGRQAQVVAELRTLLAEHPLREGLWALLMRALYSSGRAAEALEAYAQARGVIADELGADPSAELQQLHEQMLRSAAGPGSKFSATKTAAADSPFTAGPPAAQAPPGDGAGRDPAGPGQPPVTGFVPSVVVSQVAQLPADIPDFTGRAEHMQELRDLLAGRAARTARGRSWWRRSSGLGDWARRPWPSIPRTCSAGTSRTASSTPTCAGRARSRPRPATSWPGSCGIWGWTRDAFRRVRKNVRRSSAAG